MFKMAFNKIFMKRLITTLPLVLCLLFNLQAQDLYYLQENWEEPSSYSLWTQTPVIVNKEWKVSYGSQFEKDGTPFSPEIPYQGAFNMGIFFQSLSLDTVKLITPALELDGAVKPTLRFHHCQYTSIRGPDNLKLFFRAGPNSSWDLIEEWTSDISEWVDEIVDIENKGAKYLTDTFQIAFEGIIGNGYGVYIDSVTVKEDDVVPMFVKKTSYESLEYSAIPAGALDIPLEEIVIRVLGNVGSAVLDTLTIVPTGAGTNYLEPGSFKLFYNRDGVYLPFKADTSAQIGTASLVDGEVVFSDLNQYLSLGNNHLFVTASFKNTLSGNANLRFEIPAEGISVNDTLFPASTKILDENHLLKEVAFYDDFESGGSGWTLDNNFEVGWPDGNQIGSQKNPESPFNGNSILATDLDGPYLTSIDSGSMYFAYTPEIDLTYYVRPELNYHNQTLISGSDQAVADYSIDGGVTWHNFWLSTGANNNSYWFEIYNKNLSDIAKRQPQFQLRFGIVHSETVEWPGFGIDNFAIIAEKLHTDVGVTDIISPYDNCINCGSDTVKVWFRNYADGAAPDTIPVYYGLWGADSVIVTDTIFGGIAKDDSVLFTFNQKAIFPRGDFYDNFIVGVDLAGDQDSENDTLTKALVMQNYYAPTHLEDFEYKGGIWQTQDTASWLAFDATGIVDPNNPLTPTTWVLSPTGPYIGNDSSWVTSGCYNLSDVSRNIVKFKYWAETENEKDGVRIEYTQDDGLTWDVLDDPEYGLDWNWMPDTVEALKSRGWTGSYSSSWNEAQALLPWDLDTASKVKFRVLFMSNPTVAFPQGFAFDDFEIFPAPADLGVSRILSPIDTCQGINGTEVDIRIENFGYNKMSAGDTIIVGVDFESDLPVIDTLILASDLVPGDSIDLSVATDINIVAAGTYNIKAYTLAEVDPWYYNKNNDTASYTFDVWQNPIIMLDDTIGSRQPDTVKLRPIYDNWVPGYTYNWDPGAVTDSIYDVITHGYGDTLYKVTATEPIRGCSTTDSVNVLLLFFDVGVDSVLGPNTNCELSDADTVSVRIRNHGTDSLLVGDQIAVYYQINGGALVTNTITLTENLYANKTIIHNFTDDLFDFSAIGDYHIFTGANYLGGDEKPINDSISKHISVFGYTPLDIGEDQVVEALDYTLDAGAGFVSYEWNNGINTQTNYLDASVTNRSGTYFVDVLDANGCAGSDTIDVWFKIRDLQADVLTAPQTGCELDRDGTGYVQFRVINNGSDTILMSDNITFEYSLDGGSVVSETITPLNPILPGAQYSHTFATSNDFTTVKDYEIDLEVQIAGDLRAVNDTTSDSFTTKSNPIVDLGDYPDPISSLFFELDAGAGDYTYMWQDGFTSSQTFTAVASGEYSVVVTDTANGCSGSDTTNLQFDQLNYAVKDVSGFLTRICQGAETNLTVEIENKGNLARTNAELTVGFRIGNGTVVEEEHTIPGQWNPGSANTKTVVMATPVVFDEHGSNQLKVYVSHVDDLIPDDDTLASDFTVDAAPLVDFGGDTLQVPLPHQLDAGEHTTYQWQDNFDGRIYTVTSTQSQTYTVTVSDANNSCITTRSVWIEPSLAINALPEHISFDLYPNPASDVLNIEVADEYGDELFVEVYSITNQLIWFDHHDGFGDYSHKLDVSSYRHGIYLIRIRNKEFTHVKRIIIK